MLLGPRPVLLPTIHLECLCALASAPRLARLRVSLYNSFMQKNFNLPVIGVFTKQLDNWTSGSGHHLNEIMHRILDMNDTHPCFKFVFIHYEKSENPIYKRVEELIIPRNPLAAAWILRSRRFDILHYTPLTIFAPIWGVRAKKVATIHGAEQLIVPQFYGAIEMLHERLLVPLYARRVDHIITVSHTSRGFFMGRYRVPGDRITVCPNAVSPLYRILPDRLPATPLNPGSVPSASARLKESEGITPLPVPSQEKNGSAKALNASQAPAGMGTSITEQSAMHQAHAVLGRFGLTASEPFIFHLSRFSERKNPWTLLEGFRRFLRLQGPSLPDSIDFTPTADLLEEVPRKAAPGVVTDIETFGNKAPLKGATTGAASPVTTPDVGASLKGLTSKQPSSWSPAELMQTPVSPVDLLQTPGSPIDFAEVPPSAFKLVIGGSRWDNPAVTRYLERAGIADRVIRTGFLKEEEAVAFYNYAAAFLFPSLAEGFGMPNLEAMACGCPVITSNVFAIPEVVGDAAMVLKNPRDADALAQAIWRVVYEAPLRERLVTEGIRRVKQFDWSESARKVMEVYEGLISP